MVVRSIRAIGGAKPIGVHVWIPPTSGALSKIEITRDNGTIDNITDIIYGGELIDGVTDTIGNFNFTIDNSTETLTGVWTGNEIIKISIDYATSATTLRFRGRIEKVSYQDHRIRITGRAEGKKLLEVTVTKEFLNIETSLILKDLLDTYASDLTQSNINASTKNVTVTWYQKPLWECIQELCFSAGFDAYLDSSLDFHYFESGTVDNTSEAVIHESNLFEVGDFAYDYSLIKNRVIVYGAKIADFLLVYTSEDADSQSSYGVKELIIKDESITTETQAKERADFELSISKDPPLVGEVKSTGLATIQPGERIKISAPQSNLPPAYYKIISYKHNFDGSFITTILTIEKEPKKIYHIMKDRISKEQRLAETPNPNEMRFSWNFDFSSDSGTHSATTIDTDARILKSTGSSGTWISDLRALSSNATACELRVNGTALSGTTYKISVDNGVTYSDFIPNILKTLSPPGPNLKIKVIINSASTEINGIVLLYKT